MLCTEPKVNAEEAFWFAIASEEGISLHKTFEGTKEVKSEPMCLVNEQPNPCTRCGLDFNQNHLATCKAKNGRCRKAQQLALCTNVQKTENWQHARKRQNWRKAGMRRINLIEREHNQSEESSEREGDNMALHVGGGGNQPFTRKGKINNQLFSAMIDSGSPITIFTQADMRNLLKVDVIFAIPMLKNEQYVDYNNKPLNLLGYTTVNVNVGKRTIKNARIVITKDGKRSLIRRDWLNQLNFEVDEVNGNSEYAHVVHNISEQQDFEILEQNFPKWFSREGKIKGAK